MKRILFSMAALAVAAVVSAAEPLYVPSGSYAISQAPVPESQPLPQPSLGANGVVPQGTPVQPTPQPGVVYPSSQMAAPSVVQSYPVVTGQLVNLYPNVRVRSPHLKCPHGVTEVVQIPNPFPRSGRCDPVYVEICVPPGCQPVVSQGPRGQRINYSFGGYRVQVTALRGVVTVDYDRRL